MKKTMVLATIAVLIAMLLPGSAGAATLKNSDFELGNLSGWKMVERGHTGEWNVYTGTPPACETPALPAPAGGSWAVVSQMDSPGVRFLHQTLTVPDAGPGVTLFLNAMVGWESGRPFVPQRDFDFKTHKNQQFRIDLMKRRAPLDSLKKSDILATIIRTKKGDAISRPWGLVTKDITSLAGKTVRLRLAEIDNRGCLNAMVDDIGYSAVV